MPNLSHDPADLPLDTRGHVFAQCVLHEMGKGEDKVQAPFVILGLSVCNKHLRHVIRASAMGLDVNRILKNAALGQYD